MKDRAKRRRTMDRRSSPEVPYLLSGSVYCASCGRNLSGYWPYPDRPETRSYRHSYKPTEHLAECGKRPRVFADELERTVVDLLQTTYTSPKLLAEGLKKAVPSAEKAAAEIPKLKKRIETLEKRKSKLVDAFADGLLTKEELAPKIKKARADIEAAQKSLEEHQTAKHRSKLTIDPNEIKAYFKSHDPFHVVEKAFEGFDEHGKPYGCYVQQAGDSFKVNIRARLCQTDFRSKTLGKPAAPQNAAYTP